MTTLPENETAKITLRKANHMLVAAYRMFDQVKDLNANIPVCIEIGLAFVGYAKESLLNARLEVWDQKEIETRIQKSVGDAETAIHVGKMKMRELLSKDHYKWEEYERALKMVEVYAKQHQM